MSKNKLTTEEQFLTLEQAKELQELGVDFSGANMFVFFDGRIISKNEAEFMTNTCNILNIALPIILPTLSVAEMLEMLLDHISVEHYFGKWYIDRAGMNIHYPYHNSQILLRDALFEMLRWLKQNKLI